MCVRLYLQLDERWGARQRGSASGVWESVAITLAETTVESGHYNIGSTSVRAYGSATGGKGRFIGALLAVHGPGSPAGFIAPSVMGEACPYLPPHARREAVDGKAYDTDAIRTDLNQRGIKTVIAPKSTRKADIRYYYIERVFATRYDQLAEAPPWHVVLGFSPILAQICRHFLGPVDKGILRQALM